jgi:hypothetical protein
VLNTPSQREGFFRADYLDGLYKAVNGGKQMKAVMVRYADDFVVLCRKGQGAAMHGRLKSWLEKRGLKLNEKKTRIVDFEKESFEFLGFRLAWRKARSGRRYPHCEPSPKSCGKLRETVREETARSTMRGRNPMRSSPASIAG